MKLSDLAKKGLVLRLTAPARSAAMEIVLSRRSGGRDRQVLRSIVRMPGGGTDVSVRWRLSRAQLAKLKAGTYRIRVRVGTGRTKLGQQSLTATLRFTGSVPKATAKKAATTDAVAASAGAPAQAEPAAGAAG